MNIISIIPARMGSSRFPGKPMQDILSMPMIGHVYHRVKMNENLNDVYVATCDELIYEYINSIGGKAIMTSSSHDRCTDRCAEAMLSIEKTTKQKVDIMVLVQGDEPLIHPKMIDEALEPVLNEENVFISNLAGEIKTEEEFRDCNEVKVVVDSKSNALYFSREAIPSRSKFNGRIAMKKQICVIPFKRDFLLKYNSMKQTPLEIIESVDMLRLLENGFSLRIVDTKYEVKSVDTKQDLNIVKEIMSKDDLISLYL